MAKVIVPGFEVFVIGLACDVARMQQEAETIVIGEQESLPGVQPAITERIDAPVTVVIEALEAESQKLPEPVAQVLEVAEVELVLDVAPVVPELDLEAIEVVHPESDAEAVCVQEVPLLTPINAEVSAPVPEMKQAVVSDAEMEKIFASVDSAKPKEVVDQPLEEVSLPDAENRALWFFEEYRCLLNDGEATGSFHAAAVFRRRLLKVKGVEGDLYRIGSYKTPFVLESLVEKGALDDHIPQGVEFKGFDHDGPFSEYVFSRVPEGSRAVSLLYAMHSAAKKKFEAMKAEEREQGEWEMRTVSYQNQVESEAEKLRKDREIARLNGGIGPKVNINTGKTAKKKANADTARRGRQLERAQLSKKMKGSNNKGGHKKSKR
jgi:hypothetical protein